MSSKVKNNKGKILLTIVLPALSFILFINYPIAGLYVSCASASILFCLYVNLKPLVKYGLSILIFFSSFVLLANKAFELQGQKLVGEIIEYYYQNSKAPVNLESNSSLLLSSFTPTFSKFQYSVSFDSLTYSYFHLSYTDHLGNHYKYCDKCGNFECKENNSK